MLVFEERGKPEFPEKNLSEQSREPTNSAHIWRRVRESNPGHIGGRRALSPLRQPCSPNRLHVGIEDPYLCPQWSEFDHHMGLKMENATCAFLHLASTSSLVPPVVVIRLPMYVKAETCSRISPTQLMLPVFAGDRMLISLVLDAFILRPILAACSTSVANFYLMWVIFWLSKTISSAKSKNPTSVTG